MGNLSSTGSETVTYVCSRALVQHISIICYYSESVLEIV